MLWDTRMGLVNTHIDSLFRRLRSGADLTLVVDLAAVKTSNSNNPIFAFCVAVIFPKPEVCFVSRQAASLW